MLHGIPLEPRKRVKRQHYTMRSLAAKAYKRGLSILAPEERETLPIVVKPFEREHVMQSVPLVSWRDKLRSWRDRAKQVFRSQRGQ